MLVVAPWGFGAGFPASNHGSIRYRGQQRVRTVERRSAWSTRYDVWLPLSLGLLCAACPSVARKFTSHVSCAAARRGIKSVATEPSFATVGIRADLTGA